MKFTVFAVIVAVLVVSSEGIENWLDHPLYQCVVCLCHARTGCWRRENCAAYSISYDYWVKAGSLVADLDDLPNTKASYEKCKKNENCIVGTIIQYTESFGERDCNCDEKFDCKDRAAIHLKGSNCGYPEFGAAYAARFNECAQRAGVSEMLEREGTKSCIAPNIDDCNCDGKFDCKDRLAIHLRGPHCEQPNFGLTFANRFNECSARIGVSTMLSKEGDSQCTLPDVV